jgi:predicted GIY-YIG superfamily endonuclease
MKVVNQNGTLYIGIPQGLAQAKDVHAGDEYEWTLDGNGRLVLVEAQE